MVKGSTLEPTHPPTGPKLPPTHPPSIPLPFQARPTLSKRPLLVLRTDLVLQGLPSAPERISSRQGSSLLCQHWQPEVNLCVPLFSVRPLWRRKSRCIGIAQITDCQTTFLSWTDTPQMTALRSKVDVVAFVFARPPLRWNLGLNCPARGGRLLSSGTRLPPPPSLPSGPT